MAFSSFEPLNEGSLIEYIKATPPLFGKIGNTLEALQVKEVGDGNLNFVFIVSNRFGSFVLKQAIPYIRCIGEAWPMTKERAYFEARALKDHGRWCPQHVPEVYHFDRTMSIICMRYLEPPHIILRKGLIAGTVYPLLAEHVSDYMAKALYHTSLIHLSTTEHKQNVSEFCGNVELCRLTEQVIFSDPYHLSSYNRWTSPYLDDDARAVREDDALKLEVAELKSKFCERAQALIHGDLHTGSIMVTESSTQIIDPEFAFYGPMGFDLGAFIGNMLLAFFAQDGYPSDRTDYKQWILRTVEETWDSFCRNFKLLWDDKDGGAGDAYLPSVYNNSDVRRLVQEKFLGELLGDTIGFGAAKMIRRIVGVAHVEDFECIGDLRRRAECERRALETAKMLLKSRKQFCSIAHVLSATAELHS